MVEYVALFHCSEQTMTLTDLESALREVLASGQLGTPVALRLSLAGDLGSEEPGRLLEMLAPLMRLVTSGTDGHVLARRHVAGGHWSVLLTDGSGRTTFVTAVSHPKHPPRMQVLVIGNHGIARLNGSEQGLADFRPAEQTLWNAEIQESLAQGTSVRVRLS